MTKENLSSYRGNDVISLVALEELGYLEHESIELISIQARNTGEINAEK